VTTMPFARLGNRRAVALGDLPVVAPERMASTLERAAADDWRPLTLFGLPENDHELRLVAILAHDGLARLAGLSAIVGQHYPALTPTCPAVARFEREIAEQCGALPEGHPSLRSLRRHEPDHAPAGWLVTVRQDESCPAVPIRGDEVHEVGVGPVHAGVIEPGHFRLQAHGERVLALDIVLGYQHRGVECLLERSDSHRAMLVAESVAGDSVVAHASAHCGALEALARVHKSPRAQTIRGIALELERVANHLGDLGALGGDVAFQPAAAFFGRLRGECLNLLMTISGNRYGRGLVRPGGTGFDIPPAMAEEIAHRVATLEREVAPVAALLFSASSVQSRFEGVGIVPRDVCRAEGYVGLVARSCEIPRDVRHDHPYGVFRFAQIPVATAWAGDVMARALVRQLEVQRSLAFVREQVTQLPRGEPRIPLEALRPSEIAVAMEEGWRGEVVHVIVTSGDGGVRRHKVQDPSFKNWPALALAMPGNEISDFPLCNKSFNLSYAGHDL
jgi:Ni,Fe-hydrogenase III large subunit